MAIQRKELIVVHDIITNDIGRMRMWLFSTSPLCSRASTPRTASPWRPWFQQSTQVTFVAASLLSAAQHLGHLGSPALIITPVGLRQSKSRSFKVAGCKWASKKIIRIENPKKHSPKMIPWLSPAEQPQKAAGPVPTTAFSAVFSTDYVANVFKRLVKILTASRKNTSAAL